MKNDVLVSTLIGVLLISAVASIAFCYRYAKDSRETRALQSQILHINQRGVAVRSLLTEAVAYSKRDPSMTPVLESLHISVGTNVENNASTGK